MKKTLIAVAVVASSAFGASAFAADGKVNFTGEIIDAGCVVVNTPTNPLEVKMGKVAKTAFRGSGTTAAATSFTLQLKDCPATVSSATVKFDGFSISGDNRVLALTDDPDMAKGVGIQLSDNNNTVVPLYTASKSYDLISGVGVMNNLDFVARYYATSNTVEPGLANSTATFDIIYN